MVLTGATAGGGSAGGEVAPSEQVRTTLFRALAVLRGVLVLYAVVLNVVRFDDYARPGLAVAVIAVIVGWSVFVTWAYDAPRRRRLWLYAADLAVAVVLVLSTTLVQSQDMLDRHAATMPSFWVMASVLAWSAGRHWAEALAAAAVVSLADVSTRVQVTGGTIGNIFLLLLAAGIGGYAARILEEAAEARAAAERASAAYEERTRLARAVHDGVLQVLALVQRHGQDTGGEMAALGRLAGEQETALRTLIQTQARVAGSGPVGQRDLTSALDALASPTVTVSTPGSPVLFPGHVVEELVAVVGSCLDNVRRHVGADAPAWVFLEDLGDSVLVSVRDEGPGIPAGRLDQAAAEGRLGVSESICGRMRDLGGRAELVTAPGAGTEWELILARPNGGAT